MGSKERRQSVKGKLKQYIKHINWSYVVFAVILLAAHAFMVPGEKDDLWYMPMTATYSLPEYLAWRYQSWTSRLGPEAILIYMVHWNPWIWRICNVLHLLLLMYALSKLVIWENRTKYSWAVMLLLMVIPLGILHSSGWQTETMNYLWPIACGAYALLPLRRWHDNETIRPWEYVTFTLACIFACFQEQMLAILLCGYLVYGIYLYQERKIPVYWYIVLAVCAGMLIFVMSCPGNALRNELEVGRWFPEYADMSFLQKFYMGYVMTFTFYVSALGYNLIFAVLAGILAAGVWVQHRNIVKRGISIFPFLCSVFPGFIGRMITEHDWTPRTYWLKLLQNTQLPEYTVYETYHVILECLFFAGIMISVLCCIYWIFGKAWNCLLAYVILGASIASRMLVGFSATVYASRSRPSIVGSIAFVMLEVLVLQETEQKELPKWYKPVMWVGCILALGITFFVENFTDTY